MLPLHQSKELRASLQSYFEATYTFRDRAVGEAFHDFVADPERGMFKGPYLSIKLPFAAAPSLQDVPLQIRDKYTPYDHQLRAFRRLTTRDGHTPEGTILTTGTGSGKTESFLFPLLDYCHAQQQRPGIKAIILYPMNALATDQAARFARAIWDSQALKDARVTVGLLIGAGKSDHDKERPTTMGRDHVIEDRDTILSSPPDILLTNFKMLDYALMRARYQRLWALNARDPEVLRFLVLDELHTYDGAQGSDVANLIRRLKLKFGFRRGQLCPVGTSATVGDGEEGKELLSQYAGGVFGENFSEGAIIGEKRLSVEKFFPGVEERLLPDRIELEDLQFATADSFAKYLSRQRQVWGIPRDYDKVEIGGWLRRSLLFRHVVASCGPAPLSLRDLLREVGRREERFARLPEAVREALVFSLLSLADEAKNHYGGALVSIQVQLWVRELSGIVRDLANVPAFRWRLPGPTGDGDPTHALPIWHCRECGGSGWLGRKADNKPFFVSDSKLIFEAYFSYDKNIWFLNTDEEQHQVVAEYQATEQRRGFLDPTTLIWHTKEGPGLVPIIAYRKYEKLRSDHSCPLCNNPGNSISVVGGRAATIASVVTGQVMATELDDTDDRDRKLLAFTNSVQDAAHQAGFIRARNYRFTFRTAVRTAVTKARRPITLAELHEKLSYTWRVILEEKYPDKAEEAYVHQFFPARKLGKVDPRDYRMERGGYRDEFLQELELAIQWETTAEFGYNSTVGRTLERTETCAVWIDPRRLNGLHAALYPWLRNNGMETVDPAGLQRFVTGLLLRQRQRGAVSHPFLDKYRTEGAKLWNLNYTRDGRHFLNPTFGSRSRFPRPLLTVATHKKDPPFDTTYTQKDNWYHAYFRKQFPLVADTPAAVSEFYQQLLPVLADAGLVDGCEGPEGMNYCLDPAALYVGGDAGAVECPVCNDRQTQPHDGPSLEGVACLSYRCTGTYAAVVTEANYYQSVYNRRRAPRIYATDHTGLLDRGDRESKERDFRTRPDTDSLNALVATSTLEMGIDIGDLNVTMNTAVPPLPANFLQRVGRAGRKSGSALIVNLAKSGQSHDLFYFEEPLEMMAGKVHTPGCFLSAREILKRHFLAFVLDSWTTVDPTLNVIPGTLRKLKLNVDDLDDPEWVPNRIGKFIEGRWKDLFADFRQGYDGDDVDDEAFAALETYVAESYLQRRFADCFTVMVEEIQQINRQIVYLDKEMNSGKYGETDDLYKTYQQQQKGLRALRKKIHQRQTLEHLTNYGLLPNYAFPETGVTMTAQIITPIRSEGGKTDYRPVTVETTRSARAAIREMVPGSIFYTQGWQLPVTGIHTVDYTEATQPYRFCSQCDHLELEGTEGPRFCPKCNDATFGSPQNVHLFSTLREVKATASREDATIRDNQEERDRGKHLLTRHFDFSRSKSEGAFALTDIPFGVEYCRLVSMREVNAGHQEHREAGRNVELAGKDVNAAGYITCRFCGKSTTQVRQERNYRELKEPADYHYPYCNKKEHGYRGETDEVMKELFFLRELRSEVLKLLLPIQEFEREAHVQMFIAGINLGLKHFYGGNPQHIGIYPYTEYNHRTSRFDVYLMLIDGIPGGTGYLGKLFTTENITRLLQLAYTQIKSCSCQDRGRDGCYHCIFSYGTQHFHHQLSRRATEALFAKILAKSKDWRQLPNGLSSVANTSYIEESELESRFVRLFRTLQGREDSKWSYRESNIDGSIEYALTFTDGPTSYRYRLLPQVPLGSAQDVGLFTRADFLLRLTGGTKAGEELSPQDIGAGTQVPIFLDGWQYHASRENPRFATDVGKRAAILVSQRYVSWTLTYPDIEAAERSLGLESKQNKQASWDELAGAYAKKEHQGNAKWFARNGVKADALEFGAVDTSFGRLRWWLEHGLDRQLMADRCHAMLATLQSNIQQMNYGPDQVANIIGGSVLRSAFRPLEKLERESMAYLDGLPAFPDATFRLSAFAGILTSGFDYRLEVQPPDPATEGGYDKESWYYFWRIFNLLQLAAPEPPRYERIGEGSAAYFTLVTEPLRENTTVTIHAPAPQSEPTTEAVLQYYDPPYHATVTELLARGRATSAELEGSFFLPPASDKDRNAVVLAEAIIGSHATRVVSGPLTPRDAEVFREHGYTVYAPADLTIDLL